MKNVEFLTNNGVNIEKSLELFGDIETYDDTLKTFLESIDEKVSKIKAYKEIADMANYAILVHSLKSDARYFGFEKLAELSYNHEMQSKDNDFYYITGHFDELMTETNRIINLVKEYMGEAVEVLTTDKPSVVNKKAILVVDDSNVVRSFTQNIFNNQYDIKIAVDGEEAIKIIERDKDGQIIAMLLDLNMPNVDGFAVLDYFLNKGLFQKIPVAIITGENARESLVRAGKYPIFDIIPKPFNESSIKVILNKMLTFNN